MMNTTSAVGASSPGRRLIWMVAPEIPPLPIMDNSGKAHGLVYLDNAFTNNTINPDNYQNITCVLGNCLSGILVNE